MIFTGHVAESWRGYFGNRDAAKITRVQVEAYRDKLSVKDRLHQGLGRKGFPGKVNRIITEFPFGGIGDMIQDLLTTLS